MTTNFDADHDDTEDAEADLFAGLEDVLLQQVGDDLFGSGAHPIAVSGEGVR
ncbi:hypothetical protein [Streptomyces sp. NPDC048442]|uniref:hypothetical protein n=1 Tax=Streptomyces sp. NPDC048442 TaxID=3154823 RepID=UPI0034423AB9